jgi:hypothetical protein
LIDANRDVGGLSDEAGTCPVPAKTLALPGDVVSPDDAQGTTLFAVPFDVDRLQVRGQPIAVVDGVMGAPRGAQRATRGAIRRMTRA